MNSFCPPIPQPYFCGQHSQCMNHTSEFALETAKANIEKWFPLVGVVEEMNKTTYLMEQTFPQHHLFKGFSSFAFEIMTSRKRNAWLLL